MLEKNDFLSVTQSSLSGSNPSLIRAKNYASIRFIVKYDTILTQDVYVLGNTKELGLWKPENGLKLETKEKIYPFWYSTKELIINVGTEICYKYVTVDKITKELNWESNMSNRLFKVENKGSYEINEEKANKSRKINYSKDINGLSNKIICNFSPINNKNLIRIDDGIDIDIEIRGSYCSSDDDENNRLINTSFFDILSYDQVKIDSMQKNPLTIGLKRQIELNFEEDKFIILTALLPFTIKKLDSNSTEIKTNPDNNNSSKKYCILPKYEDVLYESLFNLRKENNYDIYWFGMLENYEEYYNQNNENEHIEQDLIEFLQKEKIFVIKPKLEDYNNYWIYMSHIMGKIFYENKIPVNDEYFMNYEKYFNAYRKINELFAYEILNEANFDSLLMIQDINLALIPNYIYTKNHLAKIGFYFNSLFPSLEVFKSLQYQSEILQSIILCNLICFHHIETAMKFLGAVQRNLDIYYEVKPGGKIIINHQGRKVLIHIMQIGIDIKMIDSYLGKKEFLENSDYLNKKYKNTSDIQKEKYIYFSIDGLLDINKIVIKLQAFDMFYDEYIKKLNNIENSNADNMEKIIEVNEENGGSNENNHERKINSSNIDNINDNIKIQNELNEICNKSNIINEDNKNDKNKSLEFNKNIPKKEKSKSGINLSQPQKDIQTQKLEKQKNEFYKAKEPLLIQVIKSSENKLMNLYNFSNIESKSYQKLLKSNYKKISKIVRDINLKHEKEIIIIIPEDKFSILNLFSLYSIGDCYYSLRKDYNFSLHIQTYVYISNYMKKSYDLIINENACLSPGIKGSQKVNDFNISQNKSALENVFPFNIINKLMNENNINFINKNQIINWFKVFFSKLKKVSFYDNNSPKKIIGFGLGFSLMKSNQDFNHIDKKLLSDTYRLSNQNLIIIDNALLLQAFEENNIYQKENIIYQLKTLASQEKNKIYIISGNTKTELEENIKDILPDVGIAYEYGFFYKKPQEQNIRQSSYIEDWSWKQAIMPILKGFSERTEGSYIIEKESMISWVYKNCYSDFGQFQANEMISHIKTLLFQNNYIIAEDDSEKNMVNIRPKNVNKGYFIAEILKQASIYGEFPDMILVIGDRDGGEDMFKYLNYLKYGFTEVKAKIFSVIVTNRVSSANYYMNEVSEIWENIENFNKIDKNEDILSSKLSQDLYNIIDQSNDYNEYELEYINTDNIFENE